MIFQDCKAWISHSNEQSQRIVYRWEGKKNKSKYKSSQIMIWESWCNSLLPDVIFEFSPLYMCIIYNPLKFVVGCYSWVFTIIYCEFNLLKFFLTFTFLLSFHMIYKSEKKLWFELYGRARNIVYQVFEFDEAFRNMY